MAWDSGSGRGRGKGLLGVGWGLKWEQLVGFGWVGLDWTGLGWMKMEMEFLLHVVPRAGLMDWVFRC